MRDGYLSARPHRPGLFRRQHQPRGGLDHRRRATCSARCCIALLEPHGPAASSWKRDGDFTSRLALLEEAKTLPFGAVWDYYCESQGVPVGEAWLAEVKRYEKDVLSKRQ